MLFCVVHSKATLMKRKCQLMSVRTPAPHTRDTIPYKSVSANPAVAASTQAITVPKELTTANHVRLDWISLTVSKLAVLNVV